MLNLAHMIDKPRYMGEPQRAENPEEVGKAWDKMTARFSGYNLSQDEQSAVIDKLKGRDLSGTDEERTEALEDAIAEVTKRAPELRKEVLSENIDKKEILNWAQPRMLIWGPDLGRDAFATLKQAVLTEKFDKMSEEERTVFLKGAIDHLRGRDERMVAK